MEEWIGEELLRQGYMGDAGSVRVIEILEIGVGGSQGCGLLTQWSVSF